MGAGFDGDGTYSLFDIVRSVESRRQTLSVLNFDGSTQVLEALARYFRNQNVELRRVSTDDRRPRNVVLLHRDEEFLAASSLESVYDAVAGTEPILRPGSYGTMDYPDVIAAVDHTVFEGYDKSTMVGVSRGIEKFAWKASEGEIHTGFQRLSLLRDQRELYESLADRGVDVHVYGAPDWQPAVDDFTVHASTDDEITRTWFVAFDRPEGDRRALLARERVPDDFHGFWTTREAAVDAILARLRERYPPGE